MDLFKLVGTIAINNSEANSEIDKTSEKASSFGSKLTSGIGTVAKWGTAIVGGATMAGTALVGFASKSASTADHIDKMSQKIGISRKAYQELDFICSQSGMSVDQLQAGMKTLTTKMDAGADAFDKLGVSVRNSDGSLRSQEDVMFDTISALQGCENQTEKARLASELFGKSGTEMMPLLNGASGSIEEMKKQAHDLGLVLDDELIDNGVNLTDSLDQTKRAFASIGTQLMGSLMPIVEQVSDYIQKALPSIQALIGRIAPVLTSLLEGILPPLMNLAETIFPILFDLIEQLIPPVTQIVQAILPVFVQLIEMLLPPIVQIIQAVLPILVQLITALLPLLQPILQLLQPLIDLLMILLQPLIQLLNTILPPLITVITAVVQTIVGVLQPVIEEIASVLGDVLCVAFEVLQTVVETVINFITGHWQGAKATLTTIFNAIKTVITTVWNAIKSVVTTVINAIKSTITTVFNAIKSTITSILNGVKSTFTSVWNGIKSTVTSVINGVKNTISSGLNNAKSTVTNVLNSIKSAFSNILNGAFNIVKGVIDKIKGVFNFSWSLPKLKLPHFSISGSFSLAPPSVPHLSIDWYKKAMNEPYMFTEPTMFDYDAINGVGKVAGEAGDEMMYGKQNLLDDITSVVSAQNNAIVDALNTLFNKLFDILEEYFPEFSNQQLVLDTGVLVAETAEQMDEELGKIYKRKGR